MKRTIVFGVCLGFALMLSGCGAGDVGGNLETSETNLTMNQDNYENNLDGLAKFMKDNNLISGDGKETLASFIYAEKGVKYQFKNNSSLVTIEFYDYGEGEISESANKIIESVKTEGKINILDKDFSACMNGSGRYLMIYNDLSTNSENISKAEKTKEIFSQFKS